MSNKKESTHQLIHRNLTLYQREHSAVWQCRYKVDNKWIRATTKEPQFNLAVNNAKELVHISFMEMKLLQRKNLFKCLGFKYYRIYKQIDFW